MEDVTTCKGCGGRGRELVVRHRVGLCWHCIRKQRKDSGPETELVCEQLAQGFVDISLDGSFSILKRVVQDGECDSGCPQRGAHTKVLFVSRIWDAKGKHWDEIFETNRDVVDGKHVGGTDDPVEVTIGRHTDDELQDMAQKEMMDPLFVSFGRCRAWDFVLPTMRRNEVAEFVVSPEWAYGSSGYGAKVGPDEHILFELQLVDWDGSLPPMPSRSQLEHARAEREREEQEHAAANPPPSFSERMAMSDEERERGNALVRDGDYAGAKRAYDGAFVNVFYSETEYYNFLSEEERAVLDKKRLTLHLNRALCKLKLDLPEEALWDCDKSLELDSKNDKGLYRRCQAHCGRLDKELEKEDKKQMWILEKAWAMLHAARDDLVALVEVRGGKSDLGMVSLRKRIVGLEEKLKAYTKVYRAQEKELFKTKIWDKVEKQNQHAQALEAEARKKAAHREAEEALNDMPELE